MQKRLVLLCITILVIALVPAVAPQICSSADPGCLYCSAAPAFDGLCFQPTIHASLSQEVPFPLLEIIPAAVASRAPPC